MKTSAKHFGLAVGR